MSDRHSVCTVWDARRVGPRRSARAGRGGSGFTLVELMIAVAIIGVLSALGIVGYRRYVQSAQSNEARAIISSIRGGEEAYKAEFLVYLQPLGSAFTLGSFFPNGTPNNDARYSWNTLTTAYTDPTAGWQLLNVSPDAPVRFGYAVVAGVGSSLAAPGPGAVVQGTNLSSVAMPTVASGIPWYSVEGINDHDQNGKYAIFFSTSTSSEILSAQEWE